MPTWVDEFVELRGIEFAGSNERLGHDFDYADGRFGENYFQSRCIPRPATGGLGDTIGDR
jgi:hypothetical protein